VTLDEIRTLAVSRSLAAAPLARAIERLGFVQADPIRAPARAQDLILRQRVPGYRAGDLERRYTALDVEEDVFINYGFVSRAVHELMHPREKAPAPAGRLRRHKLLAFVRERGEVHPRDVDGYFSHGTVTNYWGGTSNATTHMLEDLHYRGWLRVARRERGIRVYAVREPAPAVPQLDTRERIDRLVDVVVDLYAPLPSLSLSSVISRLRYAVPQWRRQLPAALARARKRLAHARVEGVDWYWPADERPHKKIDDDVRVLAPFDPVVWDRRRFELLWGWPYRFEAYTPVAKRRFGYYALPLLWRERVIGWANLSVADERLQVDLGFVSGRPRDPTFTRELDAELQRVSRFLGL
jgi:uncharacterized protein YcaQ